MNRHEFYDNLNKYHSLQHNGVGTKYYQKEQLPSGEWRYNHPHNYISTKT